MLRTLVAGNDVELKRILRGSAGMGRDTPEQLSHVEIPNEQDRQNQTSQDAEELLKHLGVNWGEVTPLSPA